MGEIIILGAGAIGRGFLPWVIDPGYYKYVFVDSDWNLINLFRERKRYTTYRAGANGLEGKSVEVRNAFHVSEFSALQCKSPVAVFMSVGPRNCVSSSACLEGIRCPIILCENDPATVSLVKSALNSDNVFFAIPDVITSNTASPDNLIKDPLAVHTEAGILFVDEKVGIIKGDIHYCDDEELKRQWTAKLYLHNTPHCIAAYMGALGGVRYVHEAMKNQEIGKIVRGAMNEMLTSLKLHWEIPHPFLEWYAEKEIARFSNELLFDPISRVAREPLRKLELEGRLIGAAQICLSLGFIPRNILAGIVSAILFDNEDDRDRHLAFMRKALSSQILMTYILGLRRGEVLDRVMGEQFPRIVPQLERIMGTLVGESMPE